jgi:hypothetical protein
MAKYNFNQLRSDYMTPPEIYNSVLNLIGVSEFDIDVCTTEFNIPAVVHFTDNGVYFMGDFFLKEKCKIDESDGLSNIWYGYCWLNPPFEEVNKWVEKAVFEVKEHFAEVWGIIPCRTETKFFQNYIIKNPNAFHVPLRKGVCFIDPVTKEPCKRMVEKNKKINGEVVKIKVEENSPYKNPLCIVYFGNNAVEWARQWNIRGILDSIALMGV